MVGAVMLIAFGFLPWRNAAIAAAKGIDVYLFLIGMMLLAEVGRQEGLFDWLAALAVRYARGSARVLPGTRPCSSDAASVVCSHPISAPDLSLQRSRPPNPSAAQST